MEPAKSGRTLIDTEPRVTEYPKNEREKLYLVGPGPFLFSDAHPSIRAIQKRIFLGLMQQDGFLSNRRPWMMMEISSPSTIGPCGSDRQFAWAEKPTGNSITISGGLRAESILRL